MYFLINFKFCTVIDFEFMFINNLQIAIYSDVFMLSRLTPGRDRGSNNAQ